MSPALVPISVSPIARLLAVLALCAGLRAGEAVAPIVSPLVFPAFLGDQDRERLLLRLANPGDATLTVEIAFGGDAPARQSVTLPAHSAIAVPIELHVGRTHGQTTRTLEVRDGRDAVVHRQRLTCISPDGDFAGLRWNGRGFTTGDGDPALLIAPSLDGSEQRRWGLLRDIEGNPLALGDRVILWTAPWSPSTALADLAALTARAAPGRTVTTLAHAGDPAAAILATATAITDAEPAAICLAWGNEEAFQRRPVKELRHALIVAAWRIQHTNPRHRVLLVTPLPLPGETAISERYAQAVRDAGAAAELRVVDWHALVLAQPEWETRFLVDGDPAVGSRCPDADLRALLARALAEGFRR